MAQIVRTTPRVALGGSAALLLTLLLAGCDRSSTDPRLGTPAQFSRSISLPDLHTQLTSGPARVDVRVMPGGLIARRVEIKGADEITRPEESRSRGTAISVSGGPGTVTPAPGGPPIGLNPPPTVRPRHRKGGDGRGRGPPPRVPRHPGGAA